MAKAFTDQNFAVEVIEASKTKPILVDFWASWCGPCRAMEPVIDELVETMGDKAVIGKLNVDENMEKSAEYGIQSIPALKIFRNGEVVEEIMGVTELAQLEKALENHI